MSDHESRAGRWGNRTGLEGSPAHCRGCLGTLNPGEIRWGWGGVARNMAENLARLGTEVQLITAVGDDWWGRALLRRLGELGIGTEGCLVVEGQPTSSYVAVYNRARELQIAFDAMGIIESITPGLNRLRRLVREADIVCIDANPSPSALKTLFRLTQQYDVPVCVDPCSPC